MNQYGSRSTPFKYDKVSLLERISTELNLTRDQKFQVGKILDRLEEKRREHISGITSETRYAVTEIMKELQPDQQKKFDLMKEEFKKRQKSRE
jgi:Spy/CpxP family protein refolding chaperone